MMVISHGITYCEACYEKMLSGKQRDFSGQLDIPVSGQVEGTLTLFEHEIDIGPLLENAKKDGMDILDVWKVIHWLLQCNEKS